MDEKNTVAVKCAHDEMRDIVTLTEHPRNANQHPENQVALLSRIIRHQGWRNPIVVSKRSGFIVAGHGRLAAAKLLGETSVPVDVQEFANEADELAHLIADNQIQEYAELNRSTLADIIGDLDDGVFDLDMTGFELPDLEELMTAALPEFQPGTEDDQGRLDELAPKIIECPHCKKSFDLRDHE